ncbi:MAG: alpha-2-macroglobulin family protein [Candidatus Odyssella sp.]|nr:alpha-2-macroglobulin family protein [Candidatus Odyssella sp.]
MSLLARVFLPALLLVLPLLSLAPPAAGQPYDTPQMAAAAGRLEAEIRGRHLKPGERPNPVIAGQSLTVAMGLVRERKFAEAVPLLERTIAHGGSNFDVWLAYSNALGAQRAAQHRRALEAAHAAWKLATNAKQSALALYYIGYWHEIMREPEPGIAAYEDSLKLDASQTVRNRLTAMVMQYRHQVVQSRADVEGEQPRLCLTFSKNLPEQDPAIFSRYVTIEPAVKAAFDAKERTLCISGVSFSQSYRVTVRQGLPSTGALIVPRTETFVIAVPDRPVTLAFRSRAYILPKASRQGIPLSTVNVERAEIKVLRINDKNLIGEITGERIRELLYEHSARKIEENQGELVWTGRMRIQGERNKEAVTALPFGEIVKDPKPGIYVVLARSVGKKKADDDEEGDEYSEWATQWVVVTDIGVSTYSGEGGLTVFLRSYETAQPRAGVEVRLVARNNEVLGTATSDADGRVTFAPGLLRGQGGNRAAALLMTAAGGEFAFIDLIRTAFDLTDRGVGGRDAPAGADAFVYAERGVYRPGETVHLAALLRDLNARASGDAPLVLRLIRPDGVEAQRFTLRPQGAGGYSVSVPLARSAPTGSWRVLAHVDPKGPAVGSTGFKVEDFVPERLEMTLSAAPKMLAPNAPVKISVVGRFLYGAPAADLAVDGEATLRLDPAPFPAFKDFFFGLVQERFDAKRKEISSASTDAKGEAALEVKLDEKLDATRPLLADIRVTLNEEGGRAIERRLSVPVAHRPLYLGLKLEAEDGTVAEGQTARFQAIAVDRDGNRKAAGKLRFELVREVFEYQWYNSDGRWNYRGVTRDEPVQKGELDIAADKPAELSFARPGGRYRLTIADATTGAAASYRFSFGWTYAGESEEVPDKLQVRLDKPSYKAGETAKLSIRAPFAGVVHIVVASDRVLMSRHETVAEGGRVIDIAVDESWGTGVYVLATAYRPNGKAERLGPSRAIGVAYLGRDTSERMLTVKLGAPELMTPRKKLEVKVAVDGARGEPVFLTLAAVDEGVLALTGYRTPAPDAHFYAKRKLALELRDDYGRLIDAYAGRLGEIRQGGDGESRHLGGLDVSTIQVVSLFSGIVKADEKGEATISLDVPDFNGRLRVMAVAWTQNKVGKSEQAVTVRDPVVSTVTLPRFLAPDDRGRVTVVIHNVDGTPGAYRVRLATDNAVAVAGQPEQTATLAKDQRQRFAFTLIGLRPGTAAIRLEISGPGNFALARNWDIAVRPAQANVAKYLVSQLDKKEAFTLGQKELGEFLPGTASLYLTVGTAPDLGIADLLASLDRYPYGCAEQTTSRALPLLYLADMAQAIGVAKDEPTLRARVQDAIYRVLGMQARDGGFGMWNSYDESGGWLTAFIMDFLTQAKAKGYVVPDIAFEQGMKKLDAMTRDLSYDSPALPVLTYAHYVLAANSKGDVASLRYLHDTALKSLPTALAKAQLAAALALMGDGARAKSAFDAAREHNGRPAPEDRYWRPQVQDYGSLLRDQAGVLALASTAQPRGTTLEQLIYAVRLGRRQNQYLSTQEQAWLLLAAHGLATPGAEWKARIGSQSMAATGKPFAGRFGSQALGQKFDVVNDGDDKIWVGATLTGIPAKDQPAEKNGFEITRVFYNLKGERVDLEKVRQSDVLVAVIKVSASGSRPHQALIVDLLPAGFEIENPRLDRRDPEQMKWLPELARPRATEPRDDRFVAALDIWSNKKDYYLAYVVRAVTPGTFRLPAAFVEDMYAPAMFGRDAMGKVTILPRQP